MHSVPIILFQEHDLRYLVDKIWGGQSILSAWDDLFDLTMVRWNIHEEWSPWNCVLLTKDEASAHEKLVNLEEVWIKLQKIYKKSHCILTVTSFSEGALA